MKNNKTDIQLSQDLLKNTQAGILKSHGRDFSAFLFFRIKSKKAKEAMTALSEIDITSAYKQQIQSDNRRKSKGQSDKSVISVYLTKNAYQQFGIDISPGTEKDEKEEIKSAFEDGMANRICRHTNKHILNDTIHTWEKPYQKGNIDILISISNDNEEKLEEEKDDILKIVGSSMELLNEEYGIKYTNENNQPIEHFGYADGVSQPEFNLKIDETKPNQKKEGEDNTKPELQWDPRAPLGLALTKDFGVNKPGCYGSYMVFRKLEQNVKAFKETEEALAEMLGFVDDTEENAGAVIIGRFENGYPLVKLGSEPSIFENPTNNNFNYEYDPDGIRCPFHAHIRKTNPRGDTERNFGCTREEERSHRIVRRGIPYGFRDTDESGFRGEYPEKDVGLLFICFQSSIENQFEFMQRAWVNNNDFPNAFTGIDPIIGQGRNRNLPDGPLEQQWLKSNKDKLPYSVSSFVNNKGGEYFFAPSMTFFTPTTKKK